MKICITSRGPGPRDRVDARLGRCPYFILVNTEGMEFDAIPNPFRTIESGAGIQSAQLIVDKGVTAVLTGNCGPNAFHILKASGIHVISGVDAIVQDAVQQFESHKLIFSSGPNVQDHFGMGDSGNMDTGTATPEQVAGFPRASQPDGSIEELDLLKKSANDLRRQLAEIESRIEAISIKQSPPKQHIYRNEILI